MFSFAFNLIHKHIPFVGSLEGKNYKIDSTIPRSKTLESDLNRSATHTDRNQAGQETPPPYDRSAYTQIIDKLTDTTWKVGTPQQQQLINRQSVMQGIKLVGIAADEYDSGNQEIGLDIYLSGVDKLIMSLPNLKDEKAKNALKEKFSSLEDRIGIVSKPQREIGDNNSVIHQERPFTSNRKYRDDVTDKFTILSQMLTPPWLIAVINKENTGQNNVKNDSPQTSGGDLLLKFKQLGRTITDTLVQCVVLFKQSPLPGLLYLLFTYLLQLLFLLNKQFQFVEKVQNVAVRCIKRVIAADEKYHLHEFASEALYTFVSATLKAIVAYKETPGFMATSEQKRPQRQQQQVMKSNWIWSRSTMAV